MGGTTFPCVNIEKCEDFLTTLCKYENIVISMLLSNFGFLQMSLSYEIEKIEIGISNRDNHKAISKYIVHSTPY
jgi:hypothetical protein